jgi:hypothetical protein
LKAKNGFLCFLRHWRNQGPKTKTKAISDLADPGITDFRKSEFVWENHVVLYKTGRNLRGLPLLD